MAFTRELNEEDRRTIAEGLSEEELAVFDLLTRPDMHLSDRQKGEVKKVARELLATLKERQLVLDWRRRQQARAAVRVTIEDLLDHGLPEPFSSEIYQAKCELVYEHVYDSYYGQGRSIYTEAA